MAYAVPARSTIIAIKRIYRNLSGRVAAGWLGISLHSLDQAWNGRAIKQEVLAKLEDSLRALDHLPNRRR